MMDSHPSSGAGGGGGYAGEHAKVFLAEAVFLMGLLHLSFAPWARLDSDS